MSLDCISICLLLFITYEECSFGAVTTVFIIVKQQLTTAAAVAAGVNGSSSSNIPVSVVSKTLF